MLAQQNAINERLVSELNSMRVSLSADLRALGEESLAGQTISVALDHEQQEQASSMLSDAVCFDDEVQFLRLRRRISRSTEFWKSRESSMKLAMIGPPPQTPRGIADCEAVPLARVAASLSMRSSQSRAHTRQT